jgi:cysteinyl-tRNA synthetase
MRQFIIEISKYARQLNPNFYVIPQNAPMIMLLDQDEDAYTGAIDFNFTQAIHAWGIEDLFFGMIEDDEPSPAKDTTNVIAYLQRARSVYGHQIFVVDYCYSPENRIMSLAKNNKLGFISTVANRSASALSYFPRTPPKQNANNIVKLTDAKNWAYILNPNFPTKFDYTLKIRATNYDVVVISPLYNNELLASRDINFMKPKANGGRRQVICYMSIGEAENYMYYWQANWTACSGIIDAENPNWKGNFKVKYWTPEWKNIITGNNNSLTYKLVNAGCDGVYLDIVDAYFYFAANSSTCTNKPKGK